MKTNFKKIIAILFLLIATLFIGVSCDNDSSPSPNDNQCNYQGLSYLDISNNTQILIPDADLNTQFFPNASNGPNGSPGIEIAGTASSGEFIFFSTNVISEGSTGTALSFTIDGAEIVNPPSSIIVTCQRAGTAVGDEVRYDIEISGYEIEFCVKIDEIL
jgi:hypothetical protein